MDVGLARLRPRQHHFTPRKLLLVVVIFAVLFFCSTLISINDNISSDKEESNPPTLNKTLLVEEITSTFVQSTSKPNLPPLGVPPSSNDVEPSEHEANEEVISIEDNEELPLLDPKDFQCLRWKYLSSCSPYVSDEIPTLIPPTRTELSCDEQIPVRSIGHCEILQKSTNKTFKAMRTRTCSFRFKIRFKCNEFIDFLNFRHLASSYTQNPPLPEKKGNGIVLLAGPRKYLTGTYALIRLLRQQGCKLPIEIFVRSREETELLLLYQKLAEHNITNYRTRRIESNQLGGFYLKPHAIFYSSFKNVLFLDSDNYPVKDPSYLFQTEEFEKFGSLFWPDVMHPKYTSFDIGKDSLIWELVGIPFVPMFEQESGQLLIDCSRSVKALNTLMFLASQKSLLKSLVWGDKDLFRLAWMKSKTDFLMIPTPAGFVGHHYDGPFCGKTMAQHDPKGNLLFLHRNNLKLNGKETRLSWKYRMRYVGDNPLEDYQARWNAGSCWDFVEVNGSQKVWVDEEMGDEIGDIEKLLFDLAKEISPPANVPKSSLRVRK